WHFAEDALTSSLVDTIFRAIRRYIKDERDKLGAAGAKEAVNAYEKAQLDSKTAKDISESAEAAVKAAKVDLIERRKNAAEQTVGLQSAIAIFWSAAKDQLKADPDVKKSGVLDALGEDIKSTELLQAQLKALRERPARM